MAALCVQVLDCQDSEQPAVRNEPLSFTVKSKEKALNLVARSIQLSLSHTHTSISPSLPNFTFFSSSTLKEKNEWIKVCMHHITSTVITNDTRTDGMISVWWTPCHSLLPVFEGRHCRSAHRTWKSTCKG